MNISKVHIDLAEASHDERLVAYARLELGDEFVVRDIKLIVAPDKTIIAMPSKKRVQSCPYCRKKNDYDAAYCQRCGEAVTTVAFVGDRVFDLCHPITVAARTQVNQAVLAAYARTMAEQAGCLPCP